MTKETRIKAGIAIAFVGAAISYVAAPSGPVNAASKLVMFAAGLLYIGWVLSANEGGDP